MHCMGKEPGSAVGRIGGRRDASRTSALRTVWGAAATVAITFIAGFAWTGVKTDGAGSRPPDSRRTVPAGADEASAPSVPRLTGVAALPVLAARPQPPPRTSTAIVVDSRPVATPTVVPTPTPTTTVEATPPAPPPAPPPPPAKTPVPTATPQPSAPPRGSFDTTGEDPASP